MRFFYLFVIQTRPQRFLSPRVCEGRRRSTGIGQSRDQKNTHYLSNVFIDVIRNYAD